MIDEPRRFPPPWTVEETGPCFIVRDHNGHAYVYCEDEPGRRAAGRRFNSRRPLPFAPAASGWGFSMRGIGNRPPHNQ